MHRYLLVLLSPAVDGKKLEWDVVDIVQTISCAYEGMDSYSEYIVMRVVSQMVMSYLEQRVCML